MILKFIVNEDDESVFKSLSVAKKLRYFELCNEIENKEGEFIIIADVVPEGWGDSYVSSGHYENEVLVLDTSVKF